ncbi:MAG: NUDIX domain-containing protein [Chloroflexota bacterium]
MLTAVYLILTQQKKVLLLQRHNTGFEDGNYSLPAGHVEAGENILHALVRETKEEIGIDIAEEDIQFIHVMQRKSGNQKVYIDFFFSADTWVGTVQNCEPHKCSHLDWFDRENLPTNTIPYIKDILDQQNSQNQPFKSIGW